MTRDGLQHLSDRVPVVLFLRPFSSFSDRSLVAGILNALPPTTQVVFLVPQRESLRDWDPFRFGLAGLRFLEPIRSAPIILLCRDDEWMASVTYLIKRSSLIIIDVTVRTPALDFELELVRGAYPCSRTIILRDDKIARAVDANLPSAFKTIGSRSLTCLAIFGPVEA